MKTALHPVYDFETQDGIWYSLIIKHCKDGNCWIQDPLCKVEVTEELLRKTDGFEPDVRG